MINRSQLRCVSCGTTIITRTGIGHGTVQKHKFACPTCGIGIGFVLHLDQEAVTLDYVEPSNATWVSGDAESPTVLFYPEVMIPKGLPYPMSPFVATSGNFKDIREYQGVEAARRHIKENVWPVLQRVYVHFENRNLDLMKKDAASIVHEVPNLPDGEQWADWLMSITRHYFDYFVADPAGVELAGRTPALAVVRDKQAVRTIGAQYVTSGRMAALWKELKSVRRQFMELYESLLPFLMVRRYWQDNHQDLNGYEVSIKNFEDLKGFYIDCVETAFRLLVMGLALALIKETGTPIIKTAKGDKDIWWFEQLNNGIKCGQLDKHSEFASITDALDLGLRNGVGHHSAHYEIGSDEIAYVKADDASLHQTTLPYTSFVDKVFATYCAFEQSTTYFHFLFVAGKGNL